MQHITIDDVTKEMGPLAITGVEKSTTKSGHEVWHMFLKIAGTNHLEIRYYPARNQVKVFKGVRELI